MEAMLSWGNVFVADIVLICTILFLSYRLRSAKGNDKHPAKVSRTLAHPLTFY